MFWFKNLMAYRLTQQIDFSNIEQALQTIRYTPCSSTDMSRFGWEKPLKTSEQLHFEASGHIFLISCKEEKDLPASVIKKETEEKIIELEEKEQRKLKKTEKQAVKDLVVSTLLPRAFSKYQFTALWIDTKKGFIYVDSNSAKRSEDTLALLRKSLGSLPVVPLSYQIDPTQIMTSWLVKDAPSWLTILEDGKLKCFDTNSIAIFKRQDLSGEEVMTFLHSGAFAVNLALEWENNLSFALNEDGTLSKLKFADEVREKNDDILQEDVAQRCDADFLLMTTTISHLMENLADEFGGVRGK
ncbi:recombination-associated protein RdgC [Mannheimia pernigra]|uniref:recombination-associated protein RdgC n=1 Tax=Mannheimia pernigra TaxID=111844 RepID=UPI00159F3F41|nr:recombination-associated protein RdgC [Mannheimia pernigra]QLB44370.1 recombination-associated protein RdgC [Mannheimia pernigra]QLB44437.1 recombination-associated protein RdgC [Mannheimia pernigra]